MEIITLLGRAGSAVSHCEGDSFQHTDIKRKPHASDQDQWVQQCSSEYDQIQNRKHRTRGNFFCSWQEIKGVQQRPKDQRENCLWGNNTVLRCCNKLKSEVIKLLCPATLNVKYTWIHLNWQWDTGVWPHVS